MVLLFDIVFMPEIERVYIYSTLAAVLVCVHLNCEGHFFSTLLTSCWSHLWGGQCAAGGKISAKMDEIRLDVADWSIRVLTCGLTVSTILSISLVMMHEDFASTAGILLLMSCLSYACLLPFASGIFKLSIRRLELAVLLVNLILCIRTASMTASETAFFVNGGLRMSCRMVCSIMLMNRRVNLLCNTMVSAAQLYQFQTAREMLRAPIYLGHFITTEAVLFFTIFASGYLVEEIIRSRVSELCEEEASKLALQHSLHANRKMLTVLCDADVELNNDRQLIGESPKLGHMLMTSTGQISGDSGKLFEDFIKAEDRNRFNAFISLNSSEEVSNSPSCVQVVLQGAAGLEFQVELFHVPVVSFTEGTDTCSHLIGIKEVESIGSAAYRGQAAAAVTGDDVTLRGDEGSRSGRRPRSAATSTSSSIPCNGGSWTSRLKSVQVQVDAGLPALPVKSIVFAFDNTTSHSLRAFMPETSFHRLYSWLVMSVVSMECGNEPENRKLPEVSLDFGAFGGFLAGEISLEEGPAQDRADGCKRWVKLACQDSSLTED